MVWRHLYDAVLPFVAGFMAFLSSTLLTAVLWCRQQTETVDEEVEVDAVQTFFITMFTIMAFAFVPAAWIMYIVREKDTKCKHQQVNSSELKLTQVPCSSAVQGARIGCCGGGSKWVA